MVALGEGIKENRLMNPKRNKGAISYRIEGVLFFIGLVMIYNLIGVAVINDNASSRLTYYDFYNQDENIDVVVIGSSRVYQGFNPLVFDENTGVNSFNLGTASQTLDASFYEIKESIKRYDIDTIYLSVEYDILTRNIGGQKNTWIISDYMRGLNKYEFIFDVCKPSEWPVMISRVYRYKNDISWNYCLNNIKAKLYPGFWKGDHSNNIYSNYDYYVYKGLNYGEKENEGYDYFAYKESYGEFDVVSPEHYNPKMIKYLKKSIDLCKKNGVNLVLVTMPESKFYISQAGEYELFTKFMNELAAEFDILYFDFNLLSDECFSDDEFANLDHLTLEGATHFSKILSDLYIDSNSHEFYDSFDDNLYIGIEGILYYVNEVDGKFQYTWRVFTKSPDNYLYRICTFSETMELIYDSKLQEDNSILLNEMPKVIIIEIYNIYGDWIGNAKFL